MYHLIIYKAIANPQLRIVSVPDGKIWDFTNEELAVSPTYADTADALTRNDDINGIPIQLPSNLSCGLYDILIYDTASPANTDIPIIGRRIDWSGTRLMQCVALPEEV